jgi:hypothetical protein
MKRNVSKKPGDPISPNTPSETWAEDELVSTWREFAQDLTGKKVGIKIHTEYAGWKKCVTDVTGLHPRFVDGACTSLRSGKFTIHLYVPNDRKLDERFEHFLHELAHIHLGHLGESEKGLLEMESEADVWVAVNFSDELRLIDRLRQWTYFDHESEGSRNWQMIAPEMKERVRRKVGKSFFLSDGEKAPLIPWLTGAKRELEDHLKWAGKMAEVANRLTASMVDHELGTEASSR